MNILVALGGNAIVKEGEHGNISEQFANTRKSLSGVAELVKKGHHVTITHGNGPQVGNILIRVEEAHDKAYDVPLGVCVAQSQGEMGYMIQQTMLNKLKLAGIDKDVVTVVTQVLASKDDPSLDKPTKPVGSFYNEQQAQKLISRGIEVVEDAGRGYRRVVPSPIPTKIVEHRVIKKLIDDGVIVVAVGGGGMPVYEEEDGTYEGIDGVVDKDRASCILAKEIHADIFIILTAVDKVALNFGKSDEKVLDKLTVDEARQYLKEGHFPAGSMAPKMEAAIDFLSNGGKEVIICLPENIVEAFEGKAGTHIIRGDKG